MEALTLLSGRTLAVYPIAGAEAGTDEMTLDTSGQYLSLSRKKSPPAPGGDDPKLRRTLLENAHFLLSHAEDILSDSRLFLAPVRGIQSGLAYTGTGGFRCPTLGVYIEWWLSCRHARATTQDGHLWLLWRLAGSPLSGANKCALVDAYGNFDEHSIPGFSAAWHSFAEINQRYTPFKGTCQAYSLEEAVSLLEERHGRPPLGVRNLLLHIPHSGTEGLVWAGWEDYARLWEHVRRWTDWHTDYLFHCRHPRVKNVIFNTSRFVVDPERLADDPLEAQGQGIVYTRFEGLKRDLSEQERASLMKKVYQRHINRFDLHLHHGDLLLDCHSFPADMAPEVDICLGFNDDFSRPSDEVVSLVRRHFEEAGYRVALNHPYANSLTPVEGRDYRSLMIELNKRLYLDPSTLSLLPSAAPLRACLQSLYPKLLGEV